tara:strand:- start:669 stop:1916 length:1248 start_codon:yes stop_codon:yes gene_type:complete
MVSSRGATFRCSNGKTYLDLVAQSMSASLGHQHPEVVAAMKAQLDTLPYAAPAFATEIRARLGQRLARLCPGNLDTFLFTLGGADANENAIRIARAVTGRHKILSRYRSYHGATAGALQLTGDPRRWPGEPGPPGFVKVLDPKPYSFRFAEDPEAITGAHLRYLEEVIDAEGADQIAAFFMETMTGINGAEPPPTPDYLRRLKAMLDRRGILLVLDEVLCGAGRTGRFLAAEHEGVVPDLVTLAKGITGGHAPLGVVGMSRTIADRFDQNPYPGGLTYNSHPMCLVAADATLKVLEEEDLMSRARELETVLIKGLTELKGRHPSLASFRCRGLLAMMDLGRDGKGTPIAPFNGTHPLMERFKSLLLERGIYTAIRWSHVMITPPLVISEEEIATALAAFDEALKITDEMHPSHST